MNSVPVGGAPALFALSESRPLAAAVSQHAGLPLHSLEERRFEGGEFKLRPLESVRGRTVVVLQSLAGTQQVPVSERFVRLLFLLNGLRDAGAARRIVVVPYLAFARKERRTQLRDPVNTRYVAQLLECSGADGLIALDVHSPASLDNAFRIPVDHLTALPMMAEHFATRFPDADLAVASPDVGGIKRVQIFRELLEKRLGRPVDLTFIEKRRAAGIVTGGAVVGGVRDRTVIVLDDLCATGGTLVRAADACCHAGASAVHVAATHAPLPMGIEALLNAGSIASVVVTDSVGPEVDYLSATPPTSNRLSVLSTAPLFGLALKRLFSGKPLAPLLETWPIPVD